MALEVFSRSFLQSSLLYDRARAVRVVWSHQDRLFLCKWVRMSALPVSCCHSLTDLRRRSRACSHCVAVIMLLLLWIQNPDALYFVSMAHHSDVLFMEINLDI